jgi:hypothetical protein
MQMLQIKNNPLSGNNTSELAEIENACKGREKLPVSVTNRGIHGLEREIGGIQRYIIL